RNPVPEGSLAPKPEPATEVDERPVASSTVEAVDSYAAEHEEWHRQLAEIGGRSPLIHFEDEGSDGIDLSKGHPAGLPQFITGQKILLSALIRDDLALRGAR